MPLGPDQRRCVLITGARGGLGASAARRFLAGGWRVAAADLEAPDPASLDLPSGDSRDEDAILPLVMDVTDEESVRLAVGRLGAWCPDGLDAVVTFAGVAGIGPLMDLSADDLDRVLDINLLGTHRTVRAVFSLIREAGGRIVLIGSETGWQSAMPLNGPYAMSKHALEAYADALRRELMFLDIPVVLMQPGPFSTGMVDGLTAAFDAVPTDSPFKWLARLGAGRVAGEHARAGDPRLLADQVFKATTAARPRDRVGVRPDPGRSRMNRLPVPVADRLIKLSLRSRVPADPPKAKDRESPREP